MTNASNSNHVNAASSAFRILPLSGVRRIRKFVLTARDTCRRTHLLLSTMSDMRDLLPRYSLCSSRVQTTRNHHDGCDLQHLRSATESYFSAVHRCYTYKTEIAPKFRAEVLIARAKERERNEGREKTAPSNAPTHPMRRSKANWAK